VLPLRKNVQDVKTSSAAPTTSAARGKGKRRGEGIGGAAGKAKRNTSIIRHGHEMVRCGSRCTLGLPGYSFII